MDSDDRTLVHEGGAAPPQGGTPTSAFVPVIAAAAAGAPSVPATPIAFALKVRLSNGVEFNVSTLVQMFGRLPCSGSTTN